jgi:predicted ABC-type ATPase
MSKKPPEVFVIAGPNGAGKTTFAREFLPKQVRCFEFLNADLIAQGLSPFSPQAEKTRAGKLFLTRLEELVEQRKDFAFETTLSGRHHAVLLRAMRKKGYRVSLYWLWLPTPELAIERVATRVEQGGHDVPAEDIRRRHGRGLENFFRIYQQLADEWCFFDSAPPVPFLIARQTDGVLTFLNQNLYELISNSVHKRDG